MEYAVALKGLFRVFYNPESVYYGLTRSKRILPYLITPYSMLAAIILLWQFTGAEVIARNIASGNFLPPIYEEIRRKNGIEFLVSAIKHKELIIDGGLILLRPVVICMVVYCILGAAQLKCSMFRILGICLYGEIIYRLSILITGMGIIFARNFLFSLSLSFLAGKKTSPAEMQFLSTLNPLLFWEMMVLKEGFKTYINTSNRNSFWLAFMAGYAPSLFMIIFKSWY
nr:hypothetical protein [candidate division Zixibacteria bacterium]